jgi:hypothetical protein
MEGPKSWRDGKMQRPKSSSKNRKASKPKTLVKQKSQPSQK